MAEIEHKKQKQIVKMLRQMGCIVVQTDSMFALSFIQGRMRIPFINYAKGQGYTKGVSDLIVIADNVYFVEIKKWSIGKKGQAIKQGKQSEEQKQFQKDVKRKGFKYFLIDSDESLDYFIGYIT